MRRACTVPRGAPARGGPSAASRIRRRSPSPGWGRPIKSSWGGKAGAVGAIRGIKTPSKIAKLVMEQTDHMFLVGEGASRFAEAMGFPEENLLTEESRQAWLIWKRSLRDAGQHSNWVPGIDAPPQK